MWSLYRRARRQGVATKHLRCVRAAFSEGRSAAASLVTLEQSVLPGFVPPKPLDRLVKGAGAAVAAPRAPWHARCRQCRLLFAHLGQGRRGLCKRHKDWGQPQRGCAAGIAAKQIRKIMEDLRGEVANIRAGARRRRGAARLVALSLLCSGHDAAFDLPGCRPGLPLSWGC